MPASEFPTDPSFIDDDLDPIVHSPARLKILTVLKEVESADFLFILRQTGLTRGNLSSHLSKLETVGYVTITKEFVEKIPHTLIQLTEDGKKALQTYRQQMIQKLDRLK
ncbi:MAG: transcriptional regulator [Candidatus Hermodarchaeota archaeon]|nr:transcriptional regulator [Candidatus Hermodarchaeota archaeon]